jgi:hypothetical protein
MASDETRAYVASLRRKRAHFKEFGNLAKVNEMDILLERVGFTADEPKAAPETRTVAEMPRGRATPPRDRASR